MPNMANGLAAPPPGRSAIGLSDISASAMSASALTDVNCHHGHLQSIGIASLLLGCDPACAECKSVTTAQQSATVGMPVQPKKVSYFGAYAVALVSLLSGAAVVHNIFKPDLVRVREHLTVPRCCAYEFAVLCSCIRCPQTIPLGDHDDGSSEGGSDASPRPIG